ncbi:TetR family transcriptional regulator [Actinomadura sp. LD22]|uniref:TetR family transcriptional regulator n=1 Tax=Actinomadura physcomitrii TaxID=2650748 RepID=A0A6I4M9Y9_9ACTN|nr:TetR/AcrR family transcriptional regulator [Actinomadura physcomitrii]MWA02552.1 TetR family transcriptional regulator [Actinomadura physcomitrii]
MTTTSSGKPLRADALRNRAKVLAAAEDVFAAQGTSASTEEVARRAGVGIGTVFRHFPTKESLLEAVLVALLDRLAGEARELASAADPGAAFFGFFARVVSQASTKQAVTEALAEAGVDAREATGRTGPDVKDAIGTLLERAQRAGAVRPDVGPAEVTALLAGISFAAGRAGGSDDVLRIAFDGLRPRDGDAGQPAPRG